MEIFDGFEASGVWSELLKKKVSDSVDIFGVFKSQIIANFTNFEWEKNIFRNWKSSENFAFFN